MPTHVASAVVGVEVLCVGVGMVHELPTPVYVLPEATYPAQFVDVFEVIWDVCASAGVTAQKSSAIVRTVYILRKVVNICQSTPLRLQEVYTCQRDRWVHADFLFFIIKLLNLNIVSYWRYLFG